GARMYDPVIGRFLSRDPLLIPRTARSTNPYAFAFNDPVNSSDPNGMDPPPGPFFPAPDFSAVDDINFSIGAAWATLDSLSGIDELSGAASHINLTSDPLGSAFANGYTSESGYLGNTRFIGDAASRQLGTNRPNARKDIFENQFGAWDSDGNFILSPAGANRP